MSPPRHAFPLANPRIRLLTPQHICGTQVCRSILAGTPVGEFGGYPASGRPAWFAAMDMHRIEDGRIKETWHFERLETLGDETPGDIAAIAAWPLQAEGPTAHSGESLRFRP